MPDCVVDASVVAFANGDIAGRRPGNIFDKRLAVIEQVVAGTRRLRFNAKLVNEYQNIVKQHRNDVVEALFALLDNSQRSVFVKRNTLSRQNHVRATQTCGWPSHDQHLLAAALDGDEPAVVVTEPHLAQCAPLVLMHFDIRVEDLG